MQAVYDNARGYSLRDVDGIDEEIDDNRMHSKNALAVPRR
jgi:hypothetical protein